MPRSKRTPLSPERIVLAAISLIDSEGLAGFSMRRLGASMGVQAMSLYNHFQDKEGILDAVADELLRQVPIPSAQGSWRTRLSDICWSIRAVYLRHPEAFAVIATRRVKPLTSLALMEALHGALAEAGLNTLEDRVGAYYDLVVFLRGFAIFEHEYRGLAGEKLLPPREALAAFPHVAEVATILLPVDFDRQFSESIETILTGIEQKARNRQTRDH